MRNNYVCQPSSLEPRISWFSPSLQGCGRHKRDAEEHRITSAILMTDAEEISSSGENGRWPYRGVGFSTFTGTSDIAMRKPPYNTPQQLFFLPHRPACEQNQPQRVNAQSSLSDQRFVQMGGARAMPTAPDAQLSADHQQASKPSLRETMGRSHRLNCPLSPADIQWTHISGAGRSLAGGVDQPDPMRSTERFDAVQRLLSERDRQLQGPKEPSTMNRRDSSQ